MRTRYRICCSGPRTRSNRASSRIPSALRGRSSRQTGSGSRSSATASYSRFPPPVRLADITAQPRGATWSRDGYIYVSPDAASGLSRVKEDGGDLEAATKLDDARGERTHRWPEALPDGRTVLFTCDDQSSTEYYD